jgi:Uma2 family endonuclease
MSESLLESATAVEALREKLDALPEYYEVVNDEIREIEPMGAYECSLASMLSHLLNSVAVPQKLGIAVTEVLFALRISPRLQRQPDVAFVSRSRRPAEGWPQSNAWPFPPDIAVEFVSPSNPADELERKIGEYVEAGVRLAWVVYPQTERVHVFHPDGSGRICTAAETIDASDVLPGFAFRFRDLTAMLNGEDNT